MKTTRFFLVLLFLVTHAARAQFDFVTVNGTAIITGYTGPAGAVTIPGTLGGLPVTEIQGSGFEDKGITSVDIASSVTNIEAQEFAPNDSLTMFTVDTNNPVYSAVGGVLFNKDATTLVEYPPGISGSYTIPGTVRDIGPNAFAASYDLSGVTIPGTVTNIESTAFGYCFDLTNVTIPASVTGIAPDTFINCEQLLAISVAGGNPDYSGVGGVLFDKNAATLLEFPTGLTGSYAIPNGVMTIGTNAFILCDGLTNISMPPSVASIEDGAFGDCSGLTNLTLGAGVNSLSTSAFAGSVKLLAINVNPTNSVFSSLNGVVFDKNQTTLIQFPIGFAGGYTVPNSVTSIATYAFEGCSLTDVTISTNVTSIGLDSFQGCGELTNVTMLGGVVSLGIFAFADSPNLATVTIPASVTNIDVGAFDYDGLTSIYFEGNAPPANSQTFLGDSATIYYLPGTSGWGSTYDGLTAMIEDAPNPNGALQVTILPPGAVASGAQWRVDDGVFQPSGATVLGLSVGQHTVSFTAISGWTAPGNELVSIIAAATNTASGTYTQQAAPASDFTYVTNDGAIAITGYIGPGGSVEIPSTINTLPVTVISNEAFAYNTTLTSVTIPDSVTNLGDQIFSSCSGLTAVSISTNVTTISYGTFEDCYNLSDVTLGGDVTSIDDYAFASCPDLSNLPIPNTLTNLGQYAFFGDGLTNATIPAGLTSIGEAAFFFCNTLPAITVDPANPAYSSVAGVLFNKNQTELLEYPDGNLQSSYTISNSVTSIGDMAFDSCPLSSVTIPTNVTNIGNYSFEACSYLTVVTIPDSVVSIGDAAFAECAGLTGILIPASVINLGEVPFANCASMTAITVAAGNPVFASVYGVLYNAPATQLVEYPGGLTGSFAIPMGVGDVGSQAFAGCQLTNVTIPASVTNIELDGFFNCDLQRVNFTEGLVAIGVGAFESCYSLTSVTLPPSVTSIGFAAFASCSALTAVVVPSAATNVEDYAFAFNDNLATAYFEGNAPPDDGTVCENDSHATVYYLPGATGWGPTFGTAPTMALPGVAITAHPDSGYVPLPVTFLAAAVDSAANPVTNWTWSFGDGSAGVGQNPSYTYTAFGLFAAAVIETNNAGLPVAGGVLSITVAPQPPNLGIIALSVTGSNLVLDSTNGQFGDTYIVLTSTSLAAPLSQWTPLVTNLLGATGNFSITLTNAVSPGMAQQFYILQQQ